MLRTILGLFNTTFDLVLIFCIYCSLKTFAVTSGVLTFEHLKEVSQCPRNEYEWDTRAKTHGCEYSTEKPDVYHCALDDTGTKLYEVCAPVVSISGMF